MRTKFRGSVLSLRGVVSLRGVLLLHRSTSFSPLSTFHLERDRHPSLWIEGLVHKLKNFQTLLRRRFSGNQKSTRTPDVTLPKHRWNLGLNCRRLYLSETGVKLDSSNFCLAFFCMRKPGYIETTWPSITRRLIPEVIHITELQQSLF